MALPDWNDQDLERFVVERGGKPFQARQIAHWIYRHGATDWAAMRNLPRALVERCREVPLLGSSIRHVETADDGTQKFLLALHDGETVEMVLIPDGERTTLCVSSQVGCPVACVFCA